MMSDNDGCGSAIFGLLAGTVVGVCIGANLAATTIHNTYCTQLGWDGGKRNWMCYIEGNGYEEGYQCHLSLVLSGECVLPEKGEPE